MSEGITNAPYACFNSTMVRLKDCPSACRLELLSFQFHYGTIKSVSLYYGTEPIAYFNSTMVRLKDVRRHYKRPLCLFQFHYGTIKRIIEIIVTAILAI